MIRAAQQAGLSLGEIGVALEALPAGQPPTRQDWERLATKLRSEVVHRIDELLTVLNSLQTS
jgi:MerR family redox-sensitive transcriptional activator SoxR